jgi:hypothetical protein
MNSASRRLRMMCVAFCSFHCAVAGYVAAESQPSRIPPGYRVETIPAPEGVTFEVGGLAFWTDGSLLATTRFGDVWRYHQEQWSLFADGLHEPLGIHVDRATGDLYVAQRPELTRLVDEDKDGRADLYETVNSQWGFSGNYHEYAFGPVRDSAGNFYVTLNLSHSAQRSVRGTEMGNDAPYRGWCVQITPDRKMIPFASGMRSPAGLGISSSGEIFYTDNQGGFNATSGLYHVMRGRFFGHPNSLFDDPGFAQRNIQEIPLEELDQLRTLPAVWIPHGELANSPGEPVFDQAGRFGPFAGQIFVGDQTKSNIFRVHLEKVGGEYQGAAFDFVNHLDSGVIRCAFSPDGTALYAGMTDRGWRAVGGKPFALQRVIYDGQTIPFEMHSISLTKSGFDIRFTRPVDRAIAAHPERYMIAHWGYLYQPAYGSKKIDPAVLLPSAVAVSADGTTVSLQVPLVTRRVYALTLLNIPSAEGQKLTHSTGYYTLNRLLP